MELSNRLNPVPRCLWLDQLKGVGIVLVVMGHVLQYISFPDSWIYCRLYHCIYAFHMPFFFMLSGYGIAKSKGWQRNDNVLLIVRRARQLLIPYCVWALIQASIEPCSVAYLRDAFLHPGRALWFLWALFFVYVGDRVASVLYRRFLSVTVFSSRPVLSFVLSIFFVWCGLYLICYVAQGLFASFQVFFAYPSYCLGVVLARSSLLEKMLKAGSPVFYGIITSLGVLYLVLSFHYTHTPTHYGFVDMLPPLFAMLCKIVYPYVMSSSICILLVLLFARFGEHLRGLHLHSLGKVSLGIYAVHHVYIDHLPFFYGYFNLILWTVLILLVTYGIVNLLSRNQWVAFFTLGIKPC